jgi:alpha-mannosidase
MEEYPEYIFVCSQAQQYEWLSQDYPKLFAELKEASKRGQFQPIGSTWVEMDCNLPSGEGLCRQFMYGQRYYEKNFGSRSKVFWLPDTFGYAAQVSWTIDICVEPTHMLSFSLSIPKLRSD